MDLVREFLTRSVDASGGIVDETAQGLHALLPAAGVSALGLPEEAHIVLDGSGGGDDGADSRVDGRLGSPLVERLVGARLATPPAAAVAVPAELPRRVPGGLPVLLNAVQIGMAEAESVPARYLLADMWIAIEADERRSTLTTGCVRLADGACVTHLDLTAAYPMAAPPLSDAEQRAARGALRAFVAREASIVARTALEAVGRRARRDLERLGEYYASLDANMARAVARARTPDELARRAAKRAALPEDLAARRAQLRRRLSPRLAAQMVAVTVVHTDVQRFVITLRRRTREGAISVWRRAADNVFEGPACAACGRETLRLYLCDERLHVLCDRCGQTGRLDLARCSACRPVAPTPLSLSVVDPSMAVRLGAD